MGTRIRQFLASNYFKRAIEHKSCLKQRELSFLIFKREMQTPRNF